MPAVFINEVLANEPGSNTDGEFIELVNGSPNIVDVGGWTLEDSIRVRHVFALGTTMPPGSALVIYGGAGAIPPGLTNARAASTGSLDLGNGGDAVTLRDLLGRAVDSIGYSQQLSNVDGISMVRSVEGSPHEPFVLHTLRSALLCSPGIRVDGTPFSAAQPTFPSALPLAVLPSTSAGVVRDFLIDPATRELLLGPDGDWVLARDLAAIAQDAHAALGLIRGEWFLDRDDGFALRDVVLVKSPNLDLIRAEVRRVLLTVEGIVEVTRVDVVVNRATRNALVTWSAKADAGELNNQTTRIG